MSNAFEKSRYTDLHNKYEEGDNNHEDTIEGFDMIRIGIIYHDFLPTPRRGSDVKSGKTDTQSSRYTP